LTKNELKRVMVIEKWIDGHLTEQDVARTLGLSVRQAYRLKAKYRLGGAQAIAHGNRGRKPVHTLADSLQQRVQLLYRDRYFGRMDKYGCGIRAGLALCGDTGHPDPGAHNGPTRSGAGVPAQTRRRPSLEKTLLQQAVTA